MKKNIKYLLSIMIVMIFVGGFCKSSYADNSLIMTKSDVEEYYYPDDYKGYIYPVLPRTSEWPYGNHQEMVDISQIPEDVYKSLPTYELVQSVLEYPLISDIFSYDDFEVGYKIVKSHFGALNELCNREDRRKCLMEIKRKITDKALEDYKNGIIENADKKNRFVTRCMVVSVLLEQEDFKEDAVSCDGTNEDSKIDNTANIDRLIKGNIYINNMMRNVMVTRVSFMDVVGLSFVSSTGIHTPRGGYMTGIVYNVIEKWLCSDGTESNFIFNDLSAEAKASLNSDIYSNYGLTPESGYGPTVKYNCHSYAWYNHVNCNYWVNQFSSANYTQVTWQNVNVGGIAVYCNTYGNGQGINTPPYTHSAIVVTNSYNGAPPQMFILRSKWGINAVFTHALVNCPYYYVSYLPLIQPQVCDMKYYN